MSKEPKKIVNYRVNYYPCNVIINDRWFAKLAISQYYKTKLGRSTIDDEKIQELVQKLQQINKRFRKNKNDYYDYEPLYIDDYRAYNLVWDYDDDKTVTTLLIIDCYREKKYDKK